MAVGIKNCGLMDADAIAACVYTGASFIGLVHYDNSPRHMSLAQGATLRKSIPESIHAVAVLVEPDDALLHNIITQWQPDIIQVHGVDDVARLTAIKNATQRPLIVGCGIASAKDIRTTSRFIGVADYVLLDTAKHNEHGGTGEAFDWQWLTSAHAPLPWFLAGGLTPSNVAQAIKITGAAYVDVSSGIESSRGVKSLELIAAFNHAVLHGVA